MSDLRHQSPIAIVGLSALLPGSPDTASAWRNIVTGRDLITDVPASHWLVEDYYDPNPAAPDKTYARRGGFLPDVDFDPIEFGVPPTIVPATDTAQLLALVVAQRTLEDAMGGDLTRLDRERVACLLGVTGTQELVGTMNARLQRPVWVKALREAGLPEEEVQSICDRIASNYVPWQESTFPGLLGNVVAGRIANRFDLRGTNTVTDAACASSLAALSMGINELRLGQADLVLTGGVDTMNDIFMHMCFSKTPALSPTGDCRPFSDAADGTLLGEGLVMFALKRLEDAETAGDRIYAVIRGLGASSDGRAKSVYAPLPEGQARALRRAYEAAGYGPETVELVEAHGTGTKAGDVAEIEGLCSVFEATGRMGAPWCAVGSIKSQIGHTKAAAGAAGLFKAVMALHHKTLPPTIKVDRPSARFESGNGPFYVNTQARPWIRDAAHPRRASVSSFGFGGSNFHVALEEYVPTPRSKPERAPIVRSSPTEMIAFSASTPAKLVAAIRALDTSGAFDLVARHTQLAFRADDAARLAVAASSSQDLAEKLSAAAARIEKEPETSFSAAGSHYGVGAKAGRVAFLFPGQGSQYVGMGADVAQAFEEARSVWDKAAAERFDGTSVHELVYPRPALSDAARESQTKALAATEWAQPAIGLTSLALLRLLQMLGLSPDCVGGHSFGEVTALYAAGAMDDDAFLRVARRRGELMRDAAATPGSMSAVAAPRADVERLLAEWNLDVVIANHNAPRQVVISGATPAVATAEQRLSEQGLAVQRLPVATAFHSHVVAASSDPFAAFLDGVRLDPPQIDVWSNSEASPYPSDTAAMRRQLADQIALPVRFLDQIESMYAAGMRTFVEVGPSSVLTDLVGRILAGRPHLAVNLDRRGKHGLTSLQDALARLSASGIALDFANLWKRTSEIDKPKKKAAMTLRLNGSNVGKPYPPPGGAKDLPAPNPPRALVAPSTPAVSHEPQLGWVAAFQEMQRQTAETHAAYQRSSADAHTAFLRATESSFAALTALAGGAPMPVVASLPVPVTIAPPIAVTPPIATAPVVKAPEIEKPSKPAVANAADITLAIVAEKTGYPVSMLGRDMELEADLGIDSIKRVEILSALREQSPALGDMNPTEMGKLRTLGQIIDHAQQRLGVAPPALAAPAAHDLDHVLLEVVADKTGYPVGMLGLQMELEADLGIDSIKRVEILSAMRERAPDTAGVNPTDLAKLRTLGEIATRLRSPTGPRPAATPVIVAAHPIKRFAVHEQPASPSGLAMPGLWASRHLVITDDRYGVAAALSRQLRARGVSARVVDHVPPDADGVIFLGGLRHIETPEEGIAVSREAFHAAKVIASRLTASGGVFVTVQDTGGDFGLSGTRPWFAGIAALARTASIEWPRASVKAIDCERGARNSEALAEAIADELFTGAGLLEAGLHADGRRTTIGTSAVKADADTTPLDASSVVVVSGGARGVTAACMIELAKATRARIIILGRSPTENEPSFAHGIAGANDLRRVIAEAMKREGRSSRPADIDARANSILAGREIRSTLAAIESAGSRVRYIATDVTDGPAVAAALNDIRQTWGPITAIVHGAGLLADKLIADKTDEQFSHVFDTKVRGLQALLDATAQDPVRTLCLFSSVAARVGNAGQCDYAMANEILNAVACAEQRRLPNRVVRSIGWGPWQGGMVTPALENHFKREGVTLIPVPVGARMFVEELTTSGETVTVIGAAADAASLRTAGPRTAEAEVLIRASEHPELGDHRVGSQPVLPVAIALEWLLRGARVISPDVAYTELRDVKVLRGIKLQQFDGAGDRIVIRCTQASPNAAIQAEIRNPDGVVYYSATVERGDVGDAAPQTRAVELLHPWTRRAAIYDGRVLFHGPSFQVLQRVEGITDDVAAASLEGVIGRHWRDENWLSDPAALDGVLQLALLWGEQVMHGASLPMSVENVRILRSGPIHGVGRVTLRASFVGDARATCDASLMDDDGVVAELEGIGLVLRPGESSQTMPAVA